MKTIHALQIVDKSTSMLKFRSRTVEGINANINTLKKEVDNDTKIINTQLQFSAVSNWRYGRIVASGVNAQLERDFVFKRVGTDVQDVVDMTDADYEPDGNTPLLDAIGYGIEKVKEFHGDKLGDENLKIVVTVITDGEENSSVKWKHADIKKMIDHFQSDGKWTFTFVGCGSVDDVLKISQTIGISSSNTVSYSDDNIGRTEGFSKISTSYRSFATATKSGVVDNDIFTEKFQAVSK